ncbi:MAG: ADP-forming succinate--CoA ligase subunit beta [Chloroflexi bacterium]|nr:ADP-forming succinate--CoA ligase subunit beta [Chloroflexota bacterium]
MNLHEHQAKGLFSKIGIPVPIGRVATTVDEALVIAQDIGLPVVIKAQVLTGGRGKAGGVKVARTWDEVREYAGKILGMMIKDLIVHKVLVDPAANIAQEIYLAVAMDRQAGRPVLISSSEGGVEIEQVAHDKPEAIIREYIDPQLGLHDYQTRNVASAINLPRAHWRAFGDIARNLYRCYVENDATLTEINPLVITNEGQMVALDGKMVIDDNALYRHKDIAAMRDLTAEDEAETRAREAGIAYVKLNGQIGCMVNGAGLAMTTMDMTKLYGGADGIGPANFLDIGGGAQADKVAAALRIILSDSNVRSVLINIFGGITRADEVARGMIQAYNEVKPDVPIIIRLAGTNADEGREIINDAQIPYLFGAATLTEAAQKAVQAAKGALA